MRGAGSNPRPYRDQQVAGKVEFVCSDMWRPYLEIIAKHCPQALNIVDRFGVVQCRVPLFLT